MCAGGFVLATVPLAGVLYVALVGAGAFYGLMQETGPVYIGLSAMTVVYTAVVIVNVSWSGSLFVSSRLAEAQVRKEVAAREQAQTQAAHAERMTALGQLAGGIAHDFNNVLQAVSGGAALIGRHAEDLDYVRRRARLIEDAVERGGAISRRLLAFARRDVLSAEAIDGGELVTQVGELLAHTIDASIKIEIDAPKTASRFVADRLQLETVLLNLAANARDAMPKGGALTISAAGEILDSDLEAPPLKTGRYVRISVADSGSGMDAATLARAGQPFFTTKPRGKGTGLGLSMARGFAEQSGGGLSIASEPGRGTVVTLWLPQEEIGAAPARVAEAVPEEAWGGHLRVLVVDDDDAVREMLTTSLEDAGFLALAAESGERALDQIDHGAQVDALVTDLSMPGMSGLDLIRALQSRSPDLPAILLTGHVGDAAEEAVAHPQGNRFLLLQKPVSPAQLAKRLFALIGNDMTERDRA
jgi:signal transduction histidine kinase/CheY-like chemotaxis protein